MRAAALLLVATAASPAAAEEGWQLVWADEFDGAEIDRGKWDFDVDCWGGGLSLIHI